MKAAVAFALALTAAGVVSAQAQTFPARPLRLVVGQTPGGHSDVIARSIAQRMGESLGQPVVVENRGGAGGGIGAEAVARSAPDGYTLLLAGSNNLGLGLLVAHDVRYTASDFASVGAIARVPYALAVHASVPAASIAEVIAYARARPGKLSYATSGPTSISALGFEMLKRSATLDVVAVPYKGSAAAVNDFVAGRVQMMFTDLSMLTALAANGSVRVVAVASPTRSNLAPKVATVAEQGFPELAMQPWYGLVVPAGTPPDAIAKLAAALREALQSPEVREQFARLGYALLDPAPAVLDAVIDREVKTFQSLIVAR